jgi:hypothetical protein
MEKLAKKALCGIMLVVVVLSVSMLACNAQPAKASSSSIYDLNGDGKVDGKDVTIAAKAFGSYGPNFWYPGSPASPRWNPRCDFTHDDQVNGLDLALLAEHFGNVTS